MDNIEAKLKLVDLKADMEICESFLRSDNDKRGNEIDRIKIKQITEKIKILEQYLAEDSQVEKDSTVSQHCFKKMKDTDLVGADPEPVKFTSGEKECNKCISCGLTGNPLAHSPQLMGYICRHGCYLKHGCDKE